MSESTGNSDKSTSKASDSKSKDSDSKSKDSDSKSKDSDSKSKDSGSSDSSTSKSTENGGSSEKSAKESIGGATDIHYGFFSSVRTPAYRSGWDEIWAKKDTRPARKKGANLTSKSKSKTGTKPTTVNLTISDFPENVQESLIETARLKMRKSRSNYDKLDALGLVDWTIGVAVNRRGT